MKVEQLMTKGVHFCLPSSSLHEAAGLMWEGDCGFVPVVESEATQRVIGVITDRDICMASLLQGQELQSLHVREAMATDVHVCHPGDSVERAAAIMRESQVRRLPVVDAAGQLAGVISLSDLAREASRSRGRRRNALREDEVVATLATIAQPRQLPG